MREIKALETHAYGCSFRSRLEARWATVLNALGIAWEYEPEGFALPSGNYLPDFHLPAVFEHGEHGAYLEVKPTRRNPRAEKLLCELAAHTGAICMLAGPLNPEPYGLWYSGSEHGEGLWLLEHGRKDKDLWWDPVDNDGDFCDHTPTAAWNAGRAFRHDDPRTHVKLRKPE